MNDKKSSVAKTLDDIMANKLAKMKKENDALIKQQLQDRHKLPLFKTERFNHWPYY